MVSGEGLGRAGGSRRGLVLKLPSDPAIFLIKMFGFSLSGGYDLSNLESKIICLFCPDLFVFWCSCFSVCGSEGFLRVPSPVIGQTFTTESAALTISHLASTLILML